MKNLPLVIGTLVGLATGTVPGLLVMQYAGGRMAGTAAGPAVAAGFPLLYVLVAFGAVHGGLIGCIIGILIVLRHRRQREA